MNCKEFNDCVGFEVKVKTKKFILFWFVESVS